MWYVYCLENSKRNYLYVGSTNDLQRRLAEHKQGKSKATKPYLPLELTGYIALSSEEKVRNLEKYLKSGSGKAITGL